MVRVAILGATGYTALEAIKLLLRHPEVEITALTSRQEGNPHGRGGSSIADRPARFAAGRPGPRGGGRAGRLRIQLFAARSKPLR